MIMNCTRKLVADQEAVDASPLTIARTAADHKKCSSPMRMTWIKPQQPRHLMTSETFFWTRRGSPHG